MHVSRRFRQLLRRVIPAARATGLLFAVMSGASASKGGPAAFGNCRSWQVVPSPNTLKSSLAGGHRDAGARAARASALDEPEYLGRRRECQCGTKDEELDRLLGWGRWAVQPSSNHGSVTNDNPLYSATFLTRKNAWTVGTNGNFDAVADHWNGHVWTAQRKPSPGQNAVSAVSAM